MNKKRIKSISVFFMIIVALVLSAFVIITQLGQTKEEKINVLNKYDLDGLTVKEMVNKLDSITNEKAGLNASITGTTLILYDNEKAFDFKLPDDEFYLSFAPYINEVHPCQTHNLVSCRGELFNKEFEVTIIDKNGSVLLTQKVKSMNSGFIGLWLPRNIEATLTVDYNGLTVSKEITTYAKSDTCLTTPLKLS